MPSQLETSANLAQQAEHIQRVREAFLAQDALAVVVGLLAEPLSRHPRMRPEDGVMVQLVITFMRCGRLGLGAHEWEACGVEEPQGCSVAFVQLVVTSLPPWVGGGEQGTMTAHEMLTWLAGHGKAATAAQFTRQLY